MGDLFRALGQLDDAREAYAAALAIAERLAANEPARADYQRDLSVSYNKMGNLFGELGQGDDARKAYAADLAIAERLAANEPERTDYQRDLSVSHNKVGDLFRALGQIDDARKAYAAALAVRERLAANDRACGLSERPREQPGEDRVARRQWSADAPRARRVDLAHARVRRPPCAGGPPQDRFDR